MIKILSEADAFDSGLIDLEDVKLYLRVVDTAEDELIKSLVRAAIKKAEAITNRAITQKELIYYLDNALEFELPYPPFIEIVSVNVENYELDTRGELAKITLQEAQDIEVQYKAGYSILPEDLKIWIYSTTATLYENRETISDVEFYNVPTRFIDSLLDRYKVRWFG
jgi:hypothetical protein